MAAPRCPGDFQLCHLLPRLSDHVLGAPLAARASWWNEQEGPGPCLSEEGLGRAGSGERPRGSTSSWPPSGCVPTCLSLLVPAHDDDNGPDLEEFHENHVDENKRPESRDCRAVGFGR